MAMTTKIVSSFGTLLNHTPTSKGLKVFCKQNNAGKTFTTLNAAGKVTKTVNKEKTLTGTMTKITNYEPHSGTVESRIYIDKRETGLINEHVRFDGDDPLMPAYFSRTYINKQPDGTLKIEKESAGQKSPGYVCRPAIKLSDYAE